MLEENLSFGNKVREQHIIWTKTWGGSCPLCPPCFAGPVYTFKAPVTQWRIRPANHNELAFVPVRRVIRHVRSGSLQFYLVRQHFRCSSQRSAMSNDCFEMFKTFVAPTRIRTTIWNSLCILIYSFCIVVSRCASLKFVLVLSCSLWFVFHSQQWQYDAQRMQNDCTTNQCDHASLQFVLLPFFISLASLQFATWFVLIRVDSFFCFVVKNDNRCSSLQFALNRCSFVAHSF